MSSFERGLGVLVESFSEFLQRLFEGNGNNEPSEKELEKTLMTQGNLSLKESMELPFSKLHIKLKNIDTRNLDRLVVHLYDEMLEDKTDTPERLENTIMELVSYLDGERDEFSLDRNNIKNSLLHKK